MAPLAFVPNGGLEPSDSEDRSRASILVARNGGLCHPQHSTGHRTIGAIRTDARREQTAGRLCRRRRPVIDTTDEVGPADAYELSVADASFVLFGRVRRRRRMTTDSKKVKKGTPWPHLRYSRAARLGRGPADLNCVAIETCVADLDGPKSGGVGGGDGDGDGDADDRRREGRCRPCKLTCGLFLGLLVAVLLAGSVLLNLTDFFETMVRKGLVFQEGSPLFAGWRAPPMRPLVKVRIYNYTNTEEFLEGQAEKLRVQELGPYVYRETLERINVRFHDNGTMSYNEKRSHVFEPPPGSSSREDDVVVVPNLPLIGAVARTRMEGVAAQAALNIGFFFNPPGEFETLRARDFLFGYNNSVYSMLKGVSALAGRAPLPKLGLLASRSGVSNDTYTVWTGRGDVSRLDVVSRFNGRPSLSAWESDDCNRIDGSEGAFFNLDALRDRRPVHLFNSGICRRLALEFKGETTVMDGIPALRYGPPEDFFHNGLDNPDNMCYRHSSFDTHLPSGVFNNSPCSFGSPTFLSFPHFYLGDPSLREAVDGIEPPDPSKHEMYFTIHPELGMNLGAVSRVQINTMIQHAPLLYQYKSFPNGIILPVAWIETNAVQFPAETKRTVYHATFTLRAVEQGMMYAFPLLTLVFGLILACLIVPCWGTHPKEPPIQVIKLVPSV
ncbi:Scavenger receptor class B member 1 [Frankliniella fusca]|uniref:Scavenger receptor class B member 1 n=1 Tax=Frankliniella fusca TaxID=407009 RepID=A0AAE1I1M8_9NEOP|nr:Scavenger receptor class B member 1 [Frankliniella fusca]